jgi:hypothetical protein
MEILIAIPALIFLVIWFWFVITVNGIHTQLKELNSNATKQIEFMDYISDQISFGLEQKALKKK